MRRRALYRWLSGAGLAIAMFARPVVASADDDPPSVPAAPAAVPAAEATTSAESPREGTPAAAPAMPGVGRKLRVGPLLGAGVSPRPIDLGLSLNYEKVFKAGVSYNFLPGFTVSNVSLSAYQVEASGCWYPFHGSFFVGVGI